MLGDELRPMVAGDGTQTTGEKLDKDRFRRDLARVIEYYREVAQQTGAPINPRGFALERRLS